MRPMGTHEATVQALVGFAAGSDGSGIAYVRLTNGAAQRVARIEFDAGRSRAPAEHGVAYAALTAVARALVRRGIKRANFVLADGDFVDEISTGSGVGEALALPYVRLRCALNSLVSFSVATGETDDLTQRAKAEAALNTAA
jgi:hypothetical protein